MLPLTIQAHELGHFVGYGLFGLPDPVLGHSSASFAGQSDFWASLRAGDLVAARRIANIGAVGVASLMGPLVSWILVAVGLITTMRTGRLIGLAVAVTAAARFPLVLVSAVLGGGPHTDEGHVAEALLIPPILMYGTALLALAAALGGALVLLRRAGNPQLLPALLAGTVAGIGIWTALLGPTLFG